MFLSLANLTSLALFIIGASAKLTAGVVIWLILRRRRIAADVSAAVGKACTGVEESR